MDAVDAKTSDVFQVLLNMFMTSLEGCKYQYTNFYSGKPHKLYKDSRGITVSLPCSCALY